MKRIFFFTLLLIGLFASVGYTASGTKPNQLVAQFRNVSSSTKPACKAGEIKYNATYLFVCSKTNVFKRYSGAAF